MTAIASPQNPRLQALRRLHRRRERARSGRFLAEGEDLIAAAADAGWQPLEGYRAAGSAPGGSGGLGEDFLEVQPAALAAVSTLGSGTRAIAVYEERWSEQLTGPLWVYLHGLSDPGNVGAILRAAHAFGASGVALGADCADPFSPKAVRASMGAIFTVALARVASVAELPGERIALVAHAGERLCDLRRLPPGPCWWEPSARVCREKSSRTASASRTSRSPATRSTPRWRPTDRAVRDDRGARDPSPGLRSAAPLAPQRGTPSKVPAS